MTDLTVVADDLETFLGTSVDTNRATMLLGLAMDLTRSFVDPVPVEAKAVVLTVAGRAYVNPTGETQELIGPYQVSRPSMGVYLTKGEQATLQRLVGSGGAFNVDMLGSGYPDDRFTA